MKLLILLITSTFLISCSQKAIPIKMGKYSYNGLQFIDYLKVDIELFAQDSIRIGTYKGHSYKICVGSIKKIEKNTYEVVNCLELGDSSLTIPFKLKEFKINTDTFVYHKSFISLWGLKLKRVKKFK